MKHQIAANTIIKSENIQKYNPVVIHFVGGTYGNFVYRMMHRYISGFSNLPDNFIFTNNGSSHSIYDYQYTHDLMVNYYKEDIKVLQNMNFDLFCFKKHCPQKLDINKWLTNVAFYNIRITVPDKSLFLFFTIQNILKLNEETKFIHYIKDKNFEVDWIVKNNFDKLPELENYFDGIINSLHDSWSKISYTNKLYSLPVIDILNVDSFYEHFTKITKNINQTMLKDKESFYEDHAIFLENQEFLNSYHRYQNKNYDDNNIVDYLMKKFS
jgi:hypothetical protein